MSLALHFFDSYYLVKKKKKKSRICFHLPAHLLLIGDKCNQPLLQHIGGPYSWESMALGSTSVHQENLLLVKQVLLLGFISATGHYRKTGLCIRAIF